MTTVLFGARGILGSGFRDRLRLRPGRVVALRPPWGDANALPGELARGIASSADEEEGTLVVWAAGGGHIGASAEAMSAETDAIGHVCDGVRRLPPAVAEGLTLVFASSAGAVFGGCGADEVSDATEPAPVTPYGREKLRQEAAVTRLAGDVGCRVVVCRYSNLYGLAGGRLPNRGLIPVAVRATRLRQPMTVYVSPDTRRDLVFSGDAAEESLRLAAAAAPGASVHLVRDGATRTVGEVLALVGQVARRRVPVTYADRPETRFQPRVLRFSRPAGGPDAVRRTPLAAAIHLMLRAPIAG